MPAHLPCFAAGNLGAKAWFGRGGKDLGETRVAGLKQPCGLFFPRYDSSLSMLASSRSMAKGLRM
jgi:hypothetical protein